jgi:HAT1-interacting factor 1
MHDMAAKLIRPWFAQVDELKSAPNDERDGGLSAPELAQRALDRELNSGPEARQRQDLPVNDLTSMVVKKKKKAPVAAVPEASGAAEKRKAEDGEAQTSQDKKARLEESSAPWPPHDI